MHPVPVCSPVCFPFDGCRPKSSLGACAAGFVPVRRLRPCLCAPEKYEPRKRNSVSGGSLCAGHSARAGHGPVAAAGSEFRTAGRPPRQPGPMHSRAPRQSGACPASVPVRAPAWAGCARPGCRYTSGRCIRALDVHRNGVGRPFAQPGHVVGLVEERHADLAGERTFVHLEDHILALPFAAGRSAFRHGHYFVHGTFEFHNLCFLFAGKDTKKREKPRPPVEKRNPAANEFAAGFTGGPRGA